MRLRLDDGRTRVLVVDGKVCDDDGGPVDQVVQGEGRLCTPLVDLQGEVSGEAAAAAGFGCVVPRRGASHPRDASLAGAFTVGGEGRVIADHGLLADAGAVVLTDGDRAHDDLDVVLGAARWAAALGLPILARPGVVPMERGTAAAGPEAVRRGSPVVHREGEALGVHRWAAVARATGARVHLLPIWSAPAVAALRHEQSTGAAISGGTTPLHLFVPPSLSEGPAAWRAWPVAGDDADRRALVDAVEEGLITTLSTGSRVVAAHQRQAPLVDQAPVGLTPQEAVGLVVQHLGVDRVAELMGAGPRRLLGWDPPTTADGVVWLAAGDPLPGGLAMEPPIRSGVAGVWGLACRSRRR